VRTSDALAEAYESERQREKAEDQTEVENVHDEPSA
jgi:hypothetical protein